MDKDELKKRRARFATRFRMRKHRALKRARMDIQYSSSNSSESSTEHSEAARNIESEHDHLRISCSSPSSEAETERNSIVAPDDQPLSYSSVSQSNNLSDANTSDIQDISEVDSVDDPPATFDDVVDGVDEVEEVEEESEVSEMTTTVDSEWSEDETASSNILRIREIDELHEWAVQTEIKHEHLDKLLIILRRKLLPDLPKSSKTFLKTSTAKYSVVQMEDFHGDIGQFVYFGLKKGLNACVDPGTHIHNTIELIVSGDGMPLTKSGYKDLWVTSAKVHFEPDIYKPFPVAVFYGRHQPRSADSYLDNFIEDLNDLFENGIEISDRHYEVRLKCFICDTPARAYFKGTVGHTGRYACERCTVRGRKGNIGSTVYPSINSEERTDESFREMRQREHHKLPSPLLRVNPPINMVFSFVLDFMHLCLLGVMKSLMEWWFDGDLNVRFGVRMKEELSQRMESLKKYVPAEFQRKTRSTKFLARWKATEFRFFLLYCGPIVLKNVLGPRLLKHFLLFHVACRILCSKELCRVYNQQAKQYLLIFFRSLPGLYGARTQILNFHHLIHLADDVTKMGCSLSRITAFPFESLLGKMKKKVRTALRPLAQLCRRLHEEYFVKNNKVVMPPEVEILKSAGDVHSKIRYKEYIITTKSPDNIVMLSNGTIFKVENLFGPTRSMCMEGKILNKKKSIFIYPLESSLLNMWELESHPSVNNGKTFSIKLIDKKMVQLPMTIRDQGREHIYVMPLLH